MWEWCEVGGCVVRGSVRWRSAVLLLAVRLAVLSEAILRDAVAVAAGGCGSGAICDCDAGCDERLGSGWLSRATG